MELGRAQAAAGKRTDARETLQRAARVAENYTPPTPQRGRTNIYVGPSRSAKEATTRQIAWEQAKVGDIKEALLTAESIPSEQERDTALEEIVPARAEAGDLKGALETLEKITDDDRKAHALEYLAKAQVKAGDERGALALAARQESPALKVHALLGVVMGKANLPPRGPERQDE
jgi:hypothetical protein